MNGQTTTRKCDNCGQSVLQSDSECWHCGVKLQHSEPESPSVVEDTGKEETTSGGPSLQILFYAIMTAVTALALLLVIRSLGQQPRLSANIVSDEIPSMELIAPDGSFRIEVPSELVWYFPQANRGQGAAAAQLVNDPQFESTLQPLFDLVPDVQLLLLAKAESGILTVARSEQLGQLTVEQVVASIADEPFPNGTVLSTSKGGNSSRSALAEITLELQDPPMICRQHFLPDSTGAYLFAICADPEEFELQPAVLNAILNSLTIHQNNP